VGENVNWHFGFGLAGIGMVLGLVQYVLGDKYLGTTGQRVVTPEQAKADPQVFTLAYVALGVIALVVGLGLTGVLAINPESLAQGTGVVIVSVAVGYLGFAYVGGGLTAPEKQRVIVIGILFIFSALFWAAFEQAGSSLTLFTNQYTERMVGTFEVPTSWLQAINPLLIIGLAPVFAWLWIALASREPSIPVKFALGLLMVGIGFFVMVAAAALATGGVEPTKVSMLWLALSYFCQTVGELCLSPVGLSAMTKLAPQKLASQIMGVWFTSVSLGNLIAGQVAGLFDSLPLPQLFGAVALTTAVAGGILLLLAKPIERLMGTVR